MPPRPPRRHLQPTPEPEPEPEPQPQQRSKLGGPRPPPSAPPQRRAGASAGARAPAHLAAPAASAGRGSAGRGQHESVSRNEPRQLQPGQVDLQHLVGAAPTVSPDTATISVASNKDTQGARSPSESAMQTAADDCGEIAQANAPPPRPADDVAPSSGGGTVSAAQESDVVNTPAWYGRAKHLWILSYSGKPIYSRYGDESLLSGVMGLVSGIISVVADSGDKLQYVVAGRHKFVFLLLPTIYIVMAARTREPVSLLRDQLYFVYAHLIFSATARIEVALENNPGTDVRQLLDGHEPVLQRLSASLDSQLMYMLESFVCLPLALRARQATTEAIRRVRPKDTLYALLFSDNHLVTYVEQKSLPLHIHDMLMLLNWANVALSSVNGDPLNHDTLLVQDSVCLPNLDTSGNVFAYVGSLMPRLGIIWITTADDVAQSRVRHQELKTLLSERSLLKEIEKATMYAPILAGSAHTEARHPLPRVSHDPMAQPPIPDQKHAPVEYMEPCSSLFSPAVLSTAGTPPLKELWHCVFKSVPMQQIVTPGYEGRLAHPSEQAKLFRRYQHVHYQLEQLRSRPTHDANGDYVEYWDADDAMALLGWSARNFELCVVLSPLTTHARAVEAAQYILQKFIAKEKETLFLLQIPSW